MEPTSEASSTTAKPSALARIWEWLWQTHALASAKSRTTAITARQRLQVEQARSLFDLGERVRDRITTVTSESTAITAQILFHQASLLALAALTPEGDSPEACWGAHRGHVVQMGGLDASAEARLNQIFPASFTADASLSESQINSDAELLHRVLGQFVAEVEAPHRQVDVVRGARAFRVTLAVLALLAVGGLIGFPTLKRKFNPPNLLEGRGWRASSRYPNTSISPNCSGKSGGVFFHTDNELKPWVQFDLGSVESVRRVEVANRAGFETRPLPLAIELSMDGKTWLEVARKKEAFTTWDVDFAAQDARYLRARAASKTWLHLECLRAR